MDIPLKIPQNGPEFYKYILVRRQLNLCKSKYTSLTILPRCLQWSDCSPVKDFCVTSLLQRKLNKIKVKKYIYNSLHIYLINYGVFLFNFFFKMYYCFTMYTNYLYQTCHQICILLRAFDVRVFFLSFI